MTLRDFVHRFLLIEILQGLQLTLKMFFTKPVTVQYPEQRRHVFDGFRGRHAFVRDAVTGKEKCIGCMKCANICPSQCISIGKEKIENKLVVTKYDIEALRCIYCGYCVEVCPVCALVLTEDYEYSATQKEEIYFTKEKLLSNWDEFASRLPSDTYFNKFWRPDGVDSSKWTKAKREQGPVPTRPVAKETKPLEQTESAVKETT
ncbi:MAG TPA: NADH-quinone oxidoreductase subunit NuoI [Dissulfurispiraceae bacterium]|nr:NADH-quinone oxidoreductase subunit NuoI [Dissulfurispiraceae bacterium]